jgi:putative addiction module component (TIGR02574 family)
MPTAADLEHLPLAEKVQLVMQLWDQIAKSGAAIALPESALIEAERRLDELLANPSSGISEDEMWRRADAQRK